MNRQSRRRQVQQPEQPAMSPVSCDDCGAVFVPVLRETPSPRGGVTQWFRCPQGHRYEVAHLGPEGVRARKELSRVRARLRVSEDDALRRRMWELQGIVRRHTVKAPSRQRDE